MAQAERANLPSLLSLQPDQHRASVRRRRQATPCSAGPVHFRLLEREGEHHLGPATRPRGQGELWSDQAMALCVQPQQWITRRCHPSLQCATPGECSRGSGKGTNGNNNNNNILENSRHCTTLTLHCPKRIDSSSCRQSTR